MGPTNWWAYLHVDGSVHVKRHTGPLDFQEAEESPFVRDYTRSFVANSSDEALQYARQVLSPSATPSWSVLVHAQVHADSPETAIREVQWAIANRDYSQLEHISVGSTAIPVAKGVKA
jgi:hypothetical protein